MFPHERSLVKKMQGKPFALLGVNTDGNLNQVKSDLKKENITWRSWYDGQGGPICSKFAVRSFPTIFVLDEKGVIRYKNVRNEQMDQAVETLVKDLEKRSPKESASADEKSSEDKPTASDDKPAASGDKPAASGEENKSAAAIGFNVGNRAPEISGKDADGKTFKLSEYRGKVVVLDFWGFW